jgi:Cdc6-like AAA superfamily ATPase
MCLAQKVSDLLNALTTADVDALPPVDRRRFADLCRHVAEIAEREQKPKDGVLALLGRGDRAP